MNTARQGARERCLFANADAIAQFVASDDQRSERTLAARAHGGKIEISTEPPRGLIEVGARKHRRRAGCNESGDEPQNGEHDQHLG